MAYDLYIKRVCMHGIVKFDRLLKTVYSAGAEGNALGLAAADIDLPDLALRPDDYVLIARHPVEARVHPEDGPGFLLVFIESVPERVLFAGLQIVDKKNRLCAHPAHKSQLFAVIGHLRAAGTAGAGNNIFDDALLAVVSPHDENLAVGVFVVLEIAAGIHVLTEKDIAAVGRYRRFIDILLIIFAACKLQPLATTEVVHPQLAGTQRALGCVVLAGNDVLTVGHPDGVVEQAKTFLGDLTGIGAVGIHHPYIVATTCIAGEKYLFAIGAEAGLYLPGKPLAQQRCLAATDRQGVNVTQQVKRNGFTIGTHIQVHPGTFRKGEGNFLVRSRRVVDIPLWSFGVALRPNLQGEAAGEYGKRQKAKSHHSENYLYVQKPGSLSGTTYIY